MRGGFFFSSLVTENHQRTDVYFPYIGPGSQGARESLKGPIVLTITVLFGFFIFWGIFNYF